MKKLFTLHNIFFGILLLGSQFANAQTLQVSSPNGGEVWLGGSSHNITWTYANVDNIKIEYSLDNGLNWTILSSSYPASALSYNWTVPCVGSSQAKVRITNTLQFTQDESNTTFTIPEPTVDITYPNGGENFGAGTGQYITWSSSGATTLAFQYTTNNGNSWTNIGNFPAADGYCNWVTPSTASNQVRIRAYNIESAIDRDSSAALFAVTTMPSINLDKYKGGAYDGYKMSSSLSDTVKVLSPNGGEVLNPTSNVNISWSFRNIDNVKIEYSTDNGANWNLIATNLAADLQSYSWTVPNIPSNQCRIKVSALDRTLFDMSDAVFTINTAYVHLVYPNGGESFGASTGQYIEWESNSVTTVNLEYSTNNGSTWSSIGTAAAANKYANWIPPSTLGNQYLLRVSDNSVPSLLDVSDANFSVTAIPAINNNKYFGGSYDGYSVANSFTDSIKVTSPNGGELWNAATTKTITWTYNNVDNISIEYSLDDGITWSVLVSNLPASQLSYSWIIPTTPSSTCRIRIKDFSKNLSDISDAAFIIPTGFIQITYPNGGESFAAGSGQYIEWNYADLQTIKLEYSTDNGVNWLTIGTAPAANKYANWVVPTNVSTQILIRATDIANPVYTDKSNTTFRSYAIPTINQDKYKGGSYDGYAMYSYIDSSVQLLKPNGGEVWAIGTTQQISWKKINNKENIILEYTTNNGTSWVTIVNTVSDSPSVYNWVVNASASTLCKVRIRTVSGSLYDISDTNFIIGSSGGITTSSLSGSTFCSNQSSSVNFAINNTVINSGNRFIVQLSDTTGSFSGAIENIGEITATFAQAIPVTFPIRYYQSDSYRLRVIATSPSTIGTDNGVNFTIKSLPKVNLGIDTTLCSGTSIVLNASNTSSTYLWSTGSTNASITATSAGTYHVATTNSCGITRDTVVISGLSLPSVYLGVDTSICLNSSLLLNAGVNATSYLWSTGAITQTINIVTPGTYSVAVSNVCGTKRDTIVVSNKPSFSVDLGADRALCSGQQITLNGGNTGLRYLWSTGQTSQTITISQPGIYWVNVSSECETNADQINIIDGAFNVVIGGSTSFCKGASSVLTATGGSTYLWNTTSTSSSITIAPLVNTTYTVTSTSYYGCTSSTQVNILVKQPTTSTTTVYSCVSYGWNGKTYYSSGTYDTTFVSANAAGCDSTARLVLIIKQPTASTTNISNCVSYTWNGTMYTASGNYTKLLTNAAGCDSTATLNLTINQPTTSTTNISNCVSYAWNGTTYTASGTYTKLLTNAAGCDSVATLNLTIKQPTTSTTNFSNCVSYTWNGITYTASGTYTKPLTNAAGCDSTATLNLTIKHSTTSTTIISNCMSYTWNGITYTASGTYTKLLINAAGCDSIATLYLTIKQPTTFTTNISNCVSYTWNGITYTASGTFTKLFINAAGCDSTATLNLTIKQPTTSTTNISNCVSYTWNGITYTASGTYTKMLTNAAGCDSTATLYLTIKQPTTSTTNISNCVSYSWNGITYFASGTYTAHFTNAAGCDSTATLNLTIIQPDTTIEYVESCNIYLWHDSVYTASGTYQYDTTSSNGCDSSIILNLTINQCPTTLYVKCMLEGYYTGNQTLNPGLSNLEMNMANNVVDTIEVQLWSPTDLNNPIPNYSIKTLIQSNGVASLSLPSVSFGKQFYLAIKHRNSIETWSANPILIASLNWYDFTTDLSSAFSDGINPPMKNMGGGVYAIYSGDVNQDGTADALDLQFTENDANQFLFGYNSSDCNGDGASDALDMQLIENNTSLMLFLSRPQLP